MKTYGLKDRLQFGKHKGQTIAEVIEDDPTYIEWALDEIDGFELDDDAEMVFNDAINDHYKDMDMPPCPAPHYSDW